MPGKKLKNQYPDLKFWILIISAFGAVALTSQVLCKHAEIWLVKMFMSHGFNSHVSVFWAYLLEVVFIYDIVLIGATGAGMRVLGISREEAGWNLPSVKQIVVSVLVTIAFVLLWGGIVSIVKNGVFRGYEWSISEHVENMGYASAYIYLFVRVFNSPIEEVFYRGFLQTALSRKMNSFSAITLTATLFTAAHIGISKSLSQVFASALIYGLLRKWGNSLWNPIAAHTSKNVIASFVSLQYR